MNATYSIVLSAIAGFSTMIGCIFIFLNKKNNIILKSLSFAAGVMIMVSITDLIPESYNILSTYYLKFPTVLYIMIFLTIGIIISSLIDKYLPDNFDDNKLYRVGIISMLAIIVHNIPEGIATFMASTTDSKLGISLVIAISLHNIPEGISIAVPIFYATKSKKKAILYTFISGISELFGAVITCLFLKSIITKKILGYLFSTIAGIMIHISFYELIPTAYKFKKNKIMLFWIIIGALFILINHYIF